MYKDVHVHACSCAHACMYARDVWLCICVRTLKRILNYLATYMYDV